MNTGYQSSWNGQPLPVGSCGPLERIETPAERLARDLLTAVQIAERLEQLRRLGVEVDVRTLLGVPE